MTANGGNNRKRKRDAAPAEATQTPAKKAVTTKKASIQAPSAVNGIKQSKTKFPITSQAQSNNTNMSHGEPLSIQIVTGSYERILHGVVATIPTASTTSTSDQVTFSDSFLFAAHSSAIRCLAISPSTTADKRLLATGSSDERINIYSLSTIPPSQLPSNQSQPSLPTLTSSSTTLENPRNRAVGSLIHHDRAITSLHFPGKSKLFSAAEDATIAISRTRDWTVLSSIKAPIPKAQGRPSGDTAGPGEVPAGVNDFAIHPSQKLMLSVGRGERCMRLWNLMTGKKAGVLNFEREVLGLAGEGRWGSGEGRSVVWDGKGENFVVGFERGAVLFGIDSKPRAVLKASPVSKIHRMRFVKVDDQTEVLAIGTEDARVVLFDLANISEANPTALPTITPVAQIGGAAAGLSGRVKDFDVIITTDAEGKLGASSILFVTGSSDGAIRIWSIATKELPIVSPDSKTESSVKQLGTLVGTLETGDRITCLGAFVLDGTVSNTSVGEDEEFAGFDGQSDQDEDEDEEEDV